MRLGKRTTTVFGLLIAAVTAADEPRRLPPQKEPVELKWSLKKGDVFYVTHEFDSRIWWMPQDKKHPTDKGVTLAANVWKVTVAADGKDGLEVEVEYVSCKTGHAKTVEEVKVKPAAGVSGCMMRVKFDEERNVKDVEKAAAWDKAIWSVVSNGQAAISAVDTGRHLAELFRLVPGEAVKSGEWERKAEHHREGTLTVYHSTRRAKLDSVTDAVAKVTTETDHLHETDPAVKDHPSVYLSNGKKCPGIFWFDTKAGRLQKFEDTITMTGSFTANGQKIGHEIVNKFVTTVSDKPTKDE